MRPTRHARTNYRMLAPYLETVNANGGHFKFTAPGYMPLSIESLGYSCNGGNIYSMMHFTTQNGDLMRDPDMTFSVDADAGTVDPMTFQNDFMGMYQEVYLEDGQRYRPRLRTDLDNFLWQWLQNLQEQKFDAHQAPEEEQPPADEPDDFNDIDPAAVRAALESGEPSAFVNQVMRDVEQIAAAQETAPDGQALFLLA